MEPFVHLLRDTGIHADDTASASPADLLSYEPVVIRGELADARVLPPAPSGGVVVGRIAFTIDPFELLISRGYDFFVPPEVTIDYYPSAGNGADHVEQMPTGAEVIVVAGPAPGRLGVLLEGFWIECGQGASTGVDGLIVSTAGWPEIRTLDDLEAAFELP